MTILPSLILLYILLTITHDLIQYAVPGHSILNQVMRDRQQYVQKNQAGQDSHSITIMLPVSAAQDSIAVKLNPFHISWLNAYTTTCQNAI